MLQSFQNCADEKPSARIADCARTKKPSVQKTWLARAARKGTGGGTVEADETCVGRKPWHKLARGYDHKKAVFSQVERNGNVRSFHVPDVTADTLKRKLYNNVSTKEGAGNDRRCGPVQEP